MRLLLEFKCLELVHKRKRKYRMIVKQCNIFAIIVVLDLPRGEIN